MSNKRVPSLRDALALEVWRSDRQTENRLHCVGDVSFDEDL